MSAACMLTKDDESYSCDLFLQWLYSGVVVPQSIKGHGSNLLVIINRL